MPTENHNEIRASFDGESLEDLTRRTKLEARGSSPLDESNTRFLGLPCPTAAEAIRQCGDAYNRSRLTPTVKNIFHRLMAFQR